MKCQESYYYDLLKQISNSLSIRFLCPIYLVGSFIDKGKDALDIDIVMVASEDRIKRLFHSTEWNDRWFRFYKKQKEWYEQCISDMDIDFKVQSEERFKDFCGPRIKLDSIIMEIEK